MGVQNRPATEQFRPQRSGFRSKVLRFAPVSVPLQGPWDDGQGPDLRLQGPACPAVTLPQ